VFPSLGKLHNARTGMFEEAEFRKVLAELSDDLRPFVEAAYWSGWRKRELLNLRWSQIDFMRGEMKLSREHSKNGQPRVFPFSELPPLRDVLYRQRQRTDEIEKEIGRKVEYCFTDVATSSRSTTGPGARPASAQVLVVGSCMISGGRQLTVWSGPAYRAPWR
jgi:integrase